jgi:hypothetical protein
MYRSSAGLPIYFPFDMGLEICRPNYELELLVVLDATGDVSSKLGSILYYILKDS